MATGLEALASLYAPKKREPAKPLPDDIHALAAEPENGAPKPKAFTPDESAFESVLRFIGRPGYIARNILSGNIEGAYRQGADILGDIVDASLPGDWIPEASRRGEDGQPNDYTEGSDLLRNWGVADLKPGVGKLAADIGVGLVTDPLTFTGIGAIGSLGKAGATATKAGGAALAAAKATPKAITLGVPFSNKLRVAIPGSEALVSGAAKAAEQLTPPVVKQGLTALGKFGRRLIGDESRVKPWAKGIVQGARNLAGGSATAQEAALRPLLSGLTDPEGKALFRAIQNVGKGGDGSWGTLVPEVPNEAAYSGTQDVLSRIGGAPSDIMPQTADEALLQVVKPGSRRNPITGIDEAVGIEGVSVPPLAGDALVHPTYADNAASKTLDQAYPLLPTDPRFASGVDIANNLLLRPASPLQGVKRLAADAPLAKPTTPFSAPDPAAIKAANDLTGLARMSVPALDQALTGIVPRAGTARKGADLANPLDVANMQQGGLVPGLTSQNADDLPELFSNWKSHDQQVSDIVAGLRKQGIEGKQLARLTDSARQWVAYTGRSFKELVDEGGFAVPIGRDLMRESPQYAMRMFTGPETDLERSLLSQAKAGSPNAAKARSLRDGESLADYMNQNPKMKLEERLGVSASARAAQQATMLGRTSAAKGMVAQFAKQAEDKINTARTSVREWPYLSEAERAAKAGLTEAEAQAYKSRWAPLYQGGGDSTDLSKAANAIIAEVVKSGDTETAEALISVYRGLAPREGLMKVLAGSNRLFKRFATAGAFIPRLNFSVRNVITGGGSQVLANPEARQALGTYAKATPNILLRSLDDGLEELTGKRLLRSENEYAQVNEAIRQSGGNVRDAAKRINDPLMREMFEDGVITSGFIQAEDLARAMSTKGWRKWITDLRDWPAKIAQGTEQRMRGTVYKALRDSGMGRQQAGAAVRDTFYDYTISNTLNRTARDVIPFFQFTAKSVPQTLKLMAEQPSVAVASRPLFTQDSADSPVYPWMQGQPVIPLGEDEQGNPDYLTSLGLPMEVLADLPNPSDNAMTFLSQARSGIGGQLSPLIKTAASALTGTDLNFGTPFASYDKAPEALQALGVPERGSVGRVYNALAGTGLIQPLASPLQYLSGMLDERKSASDKTIGALTGLRIQSVDEDRALQQMLAEYLKRNPDVKSYESLYSRSDDPEVKALLAEMSAVKKRMKEKRTDATASPR